AGQARDKGGLVKAMLYVDPFLPADQYIVRCYNGITNSSTGNCGFSVTRNDVGRYTINFGFTVSDRFASLTLEGLGNIGNTSTGTSSIIVRVDDAFVQDNDARFYLIVY